jgi:uncharacterized protein
MRLPTIAGWLLAATLLQAGCSRPAAPPSQTSAATETTPTGKPQPKLPTITLWLGPKEILAEQAVTPEQVRTGLMFRKRMGENDGMLFIFSRPQQVSFWMHNTLLPLSCAYIDPSGNILELHDMKPLDETPIEAASSDVQYVLEMNQGWFERNHIGVGVSVRTDRGALAEVYFGRR